VSGPTDEDLLIAARKDPDAFGTFYDRYFDRVLRFFARRVSCPHLAADLTAETFAKALLSCGRFEKTVGSAQNWLFGIARHELMKSMRRHSVDMRAMERLGMKHVPVDDETIERIESLIDASAQIGDVKIALEKLSTPVAQAIVLRLGHDLSFREIGEWLGCSAAAARVRVSRGLGTLSEALHA
jgi:RNA polymerase sigma factor (sigma-70 family)